MSWYPAPTRVLRGALMLAGLVALIALLYAVSAHSVSPDSDGATVILQGQAMTHGNALLHNWVLSDDSFWTVDALWSAVLVPWTGVSPVLLYLVPVGIAVAVIGLGVAMAVHGRRGVSAAVAGGTVLLVLGLPSHAFVQFWLRGAVHTGTVLWCLVAFWVMRRGRVRWGWAAGTVVLAASMLGDLQTVALGVVPVALAGVTGAARTRQWRCAVAPVTSAVGAVALAGVARALVAAEGGFSVAAANPLATLRRMVENLPQGADELAQLTGVGATYGSGGVPAWLGAVHLLTLAVLGGACASAVVAMVRGMATGRETVAGGAGGAGGDAWRLDDLLLFATAGSVGLFVVLAVTPDIQLVRYLTAAVVFATILAARVCGRLVASLHAPVGAPVVAGVGLVVAVLYGAAVVVQLASPGAPSRAAAVSHWLAVHRLTSGIGSYWAASLVTVESHGDVAVRPVWAPAGQPLIRWGRGSTADWYAAPFQFLLYEPAAPWGNVSWQTAVATFGVPSQVDVVDGYAVLVWSQPLRFSPSTGRSVPPAAPGPVAVATVVGTRSG